MWVVSATELPRKKKVKKNNPETEAYSSSDHSCFVPDLTASNIQTDAMVFILFMFYFAPALTEISF